PRARPPSVSTSSTRIRRRLLSAARCGPAGFKLLRSAPDLIPVHAGEQQPADSGGGLGRADARPVEAAHAEPVRDRDGAEPGSSAIDISEINKGVHKMSRAARI